MSELRRPATDRECEALSRLTAQTWGDRLTLDEYLAREKRLASTAWAKESLRTFVLEKDGAIVASHESYRMKSTHGHCEGIASVFVAPENRGHGYAATLLAQSLSAFREEKAEASILYSEVGTKIYSAIGYRERPIRARQWMPISLPLVDVDEKGRPKYDVAEPLARADALPDPSESGVPAAKFRAVLTRAQIDWHRERSSFYRSVLAPGRRDPDTLIGARAGRAWIEWTPDYRLDKLIVLAVKPGNSEENERLVEALQRACWALGMPYAELWVSSAIDLPGGKNVSRDDETPMIAPLNDTLAPEDWIDYGRGCWI